MQFLFRPKPRFNVSRQETGDLLHQDLNIAWTPSPVANARMNTTGARVDLHSQIGTSALWTEMRHVTRKCALPACLVTPSVRSITGALFGHLFFHLLEPPLIGGGNRTSAPIVHTVMNNVCFCAKNTVMTNVC